MLTFRKLILLVTVFFFFPNTTQLLAENQKNIVLFSPGVKENQFWTEMIDFAQSVSNKLSMNLIIYYGNDNPDLMVSNIERAATNSTKPDGFIFPSMTSQGKRFIEIAEKHKIPSIIINMGIDGISPESSTRDLNAFLIGQITPDDENAGYELAKTLITQAQMNHNSKSPINLIAFSGRKSDIASIERIKGLQKALKEFPEVKLLSLSNTDWTTQATIKAASDYSGKETISIVWAASDLMAITLSNYYSTKGLKQGKDIFIGGIDWTKQGLIAVKNNELTTTVGGHFAEAGWALILFYDYFNGKDFNSESTQFHSIMKPLTSQNVQLFLQNNESNRWSDVNFKTFSKVLNPNLKSYKFDLVVLLRMAKS